MSAPPGSVDDAAGASGSTATGAPAGRPFLETAAADLASAVLFAAGSVLFTEWFPLPFTAAVAGVVAVAGTLLGPAGAGVERGRVRPPGPALAAGLGLVAIGVHLSVLLMVRTPGPLELGLRTVALLPGLALPRLTTRFDRGEAGWRAAVRAGPPDGTPPLARRIAAAGLPRPVEWLLLPVSLAGRAAAMVAIGLYQLTLSRLMPPACRFEPSCSRYGFGAYRDHGVVKGTLLTALRLLRCSPISDGGYDPVPARARHRTPRLPCPHESRPEGDLTS